LRSGNTGSRRTASSIRFSSMMPATMAHPHVPTIPLLSQAPDTSAQTYEKSLKCGDSV
jgi:hypothetical protein